MQVNSLLPSATVTFTVVNLAARYKQFFVEYSIGITDIFHHVPTRSLRDSSTQAASPRLPESSWSVVSEKPSLFKIPQIGSP